MKICTTPLEIRMSMQQKKWQFCCTLTGQHLKYLLYPQYQTEMLLFQNNNNEIATCVVWWYWWIWKSLLSCFKTFWENKEGKCKMKMFIRCINFAYILQETRDQSFCGTYNILILSTWEILVIWKYSK